MTIFRQTLLLACLCAPLSQAFVQNEGVQPLEQYPWADPTPMNLETPTFTPLPAAPTITTIPSMTTIPIPTATDTSIPFHDQILRWIKRQGGAPVVNPAAPQPAQPTQVSPITTLSLVNKAGAQVMQPYTQTFAAVPDQWPEPTAGTVGMGTIQGQIGQVKTNSKREEMTQTAMFGIQTAAPEPVEALEAETIEKLPVVPTRRRLIQRTP